MAIKNRSEIKFLVELDENKVPEKLMWSAQDGGVELEESKAIMLSIWDSKAKESMRIDLWTKEMQVLEMDRFMYQTLRSLSQTYLKATQNKELAEDIAKFAHYFGQKTEIVPADS